MDTHTQAMAALGTLLVVDTENKMFGGRGGRFLCHTHKKKEKPFVSHLLGVCWSFVKDWILFDRLREIFR